VASNGVQEFTGSTTQTVVMPTVGASTPGFHWVIHNSSSGNVTVNTSGGNTLATLTTGQGGIFYCIGNNGTGTASWYVK